MSATDENAPPDAEGSVPADATEPEPEPEPEPFTFTVTVLSTSPLFPAPPPPPAEGEDEPAEPPPRPALKIRYAFPGKPDEPVDEGPFESRDDGAFACDATRTFAFLPATDRPSITTLLNAPLTLTLSRDDDVAIATARVPFDGFLEGRDEGVVRLESIALTRVPFEIEGEDDGAAVNDLLPDATIAVELRSSELLLTPEEARAGNVLCLRAIELSPIPETLSEKENPTDDAFSFAVACPIPGCAEGGVDPLVATGGALARNPPPSPPPTPKEGEEPAPAPEEDLKMRRIVWSDETLVKRWLDGDQVRAFKASVKGKGARVPFEVGRVVRDAETTTDPCFHAYRAVCELNLDALVDPGTAVTTTSGELRRPDPPPLGVAASAVAVLPFPPEEVPPGAKPIAEEPPPDGESAWASASAPPTLSIEVSLYKPLVPAWRKPTQPAEAVADLLPPRSPLGPLDPNTSSLEHFREEVLDAASALAREYASMFTGEPSDELGKAKRRSDLVFELNRSGKYHAIKDRLKAAAQGIIKQRFHAGGEGVQGRYNELYQALIEEMHAALKALGKPPAENLATDDPDDGVDRAALAAYKAYADEYEINDKLNVADKWHQERLLLTRRHPDVWSDYAAFCARRGRRGKAEEAYKEALQLDGEHAPSLLGLTVLTMCDEEYQRAEVYAHAATTSARASSADPAAWALLAATYEGLEREEDAANCDFEARRLAAEVMSHVFDDARPSPAQPDAFEAAALACLDLACAAPASKVLDMSPAARRGEPDGITRALCLARCAMLSKAHDTAYAHLMRALEVDATDPRPFELLGDVHYACGRFKEAQEGYTHALALSGGVDNVGGHPPASLKLILNLGKASLVCGRLKDARGVFMSACGVSPVASTWLGAGIAMCREGDLDGAEAALAEANLLDASNADVWGYLCLVALLSERVDEAEHALNAAFKVGIDHAPLLAEVGSLFLERGRWKHAEGALRRSVKHGAGGDVRVALGRAIHERGDAESARFELCAAVDAAGGDKEVLVGALSALVDVYGDLGDAAAAQSCEDELARL